MLVFGWQLRVGYRSMGFELQGPWHVLATVLERRSVTSTPGSQVSPWSRPSWCCIPLYHWPALGLHRLGQVGAIAKAAFVRWLPYLIQCCHPHPDDTDETS